MGQGRRWLAGALVLLFTMSAIAGELPDSPSTNSAPERFLASVSATELRITLPPAFDLAEAIASPAIIIESRLVAAPKKRVFDKKFAVLAGLAAGLTVADFEMTQHCLARRTCVESDPLMPTSRVGMYATNIPLNAALFWWSYRRKEDGKRLWWLAPLMVVGSHAAGVGTNIRFVGK
jgi:hypothetical protein